jgi:hypothetical protein
MAAYTSALFDLEDAGLLRTRATTTANVGRAIQYKEALVTTTAAWAADELISVCKLPIGAQVLPSLCRIGCEASGGTGATIATLGDAGDDDRYSATAVVTTAEASLPFVERVANAHTPFIIDTAANQTIKAKIGLSSGAFTAGKKILFKIAYILP